MAAAPRTRARRVVWVVAIAVVAVVIASVVLIVFRASTAQRVICVGKDQLGNVTAWYPYVFGISPYDGTEVGKLVIWYNFTVNGTWNNLTSRVPITPGSGDVIDGWAAGGNWSIFTATNKSVAGDGPSYPCASTMLAVLGPANGPASDSWGGGLVVSGLRNDTGLLSSFNASARCEEFGAPAMCAISSVFDLNFTKSSGQVSTCGKTTPATMDLMVNELEVEIPFYWNGSAHFVPIEPSPSHGMIGWFNYTFPANGGVWQYQYLLGIAGGTSGLVFSYASCPV